jgi:hypothetical protein
MFMPELIKLVSYVTIATLLDGVVIEGSSKSYFKFTRNPTDNRRLRDGISNEISCKCNAAL